MSPAEAVLRAAEALHAGGDVAGAEPLYRRALALAPGMAAALHGLGVARAQLGARAEAIALLRTALAARPDFAAGWRNLGHVLLEDGQAAEAVACYRAALARGMGVHRDLGLALRAAGQDAAALESFARAAALDPRDPVALAGLGRGLAGQNRHAAALRAFLAAAALEPGQALHRWNAALSRLALGDFAAGWVDFEARWQLGAQFPAAGRVMPAPRWTGAERLGGRTLLVWAEQGYGDTFQFVRYVPLLAARGARVIVEAQPAACRLLSGMAGVAQVVARGAALPAHDLQVPMLSLPLAFGTTLESVPAAVPYLAAEPDEVAVWRGRLAGLAGRKVGLVWQGSAHPAGARAAGRAVDPARLAALAAVPGVTWVSLQKDAAQPLPAGFRLRDWTGELHDFAATAALVQALDLVISVDTAVAHLAGALGKPVWLLNRWDADWRWLPRDGSLWYPTLRQFRQATAGDWESVAAMVAAALRDDG